MTSGTGSDQDLVASFEGGAAEVVRTKPTQLQVVPVAPSKITTPWAKRSR